jgi:hypothetical protein
MSAPDHLGRSLWGLRYRSENWFVMMTSYFDDSGGEDHNFTFVCGWVASVQAWQAFEVQWKLFLAKHEVLYLHMKEFSQFKGPFKGWEDNEPKRAAFLSDAAAIVHAAARKALVCITFHSDYETVKTLYHLEDIFKSPYAASGRGCLEMAYEWRKKETSPPLEIEYIFDEKEPKEKAALRHAMRSIEPYFEEPIFRHSRDIAPCEQWPGGRTGVVQLQAADYLAYECRKAFADKLIKHESRIRKSLIRILGCEVLMGRRSAMDLARLCESKGIRKKGSPGSEIYAQFR